MTLRGLDSNKNKPESNGLKMKPVADEVVVGLVQGLVSLLLGSKLNEFDLRRRGL